MVGIPYLRARVEKTKLIAVVALFLLASASATVELRDRLESHGVMDLNGNSIVGLQNPDDPQDAVNKRYVENNFANKSFVTNRTGIPTGNEPYLNWYKSSDLVEGDPGFGDGNGWQDCGFSGSSSKTASTSVSCPSDEVLIAKGSKRGFSTCPSGIDGWYDSYFDLDSSGSRVFTRGSPNLGGGTSVSYTSGTGTYVTAVVMCMET